VPFKGCEVIDKLIDRLKDVVGGVLESVDGERRSDLTITSDDDFPGVAADRPSQSQHLDGVGHHQAVHAQLDFRATRFSGATRKQIADREPA
jgi:hypothetical protein